ncbi:MAG: ArsB/NhaD family transporter, partial [Rhodothermia bacterium]|nr:ArsB/NhaD family transporter [Rhodothermia bacterium]MCS7155712.1 ArsB/NhaD family transporter [Bacteroidota bacterium]
MLANWLLGFWYFAAEAAQDIQWFAQEYEFWIATGIFLAVYVAIVFYEKKLHKTIIALLGAAAMLTLHITEQDQSFYTHEYGVDWNVIFLLMGMMVIINVLKETGLFEYVAVWSVHVSRGNPTLILVVLNLATAFFSAFLDNVTTVLLMAPVTIAICKDLKITPVPFLISEALASNIGGTATLIGDPPNIMIASRTGLSFMEFITNLGPAVLLILLFYVPVLRWVFARGIRVSEQDRLRILALDPKSQIKDWVLLRKSLLVLALVIVGFAVHGVLHYQPATVALAGAALLLALRRHNPHHTLAEVEWNTIFFFIGLFIVIGGIVRVGLIKLLAEQALLLTQGDLFKTSILILWVSAVLSAFVDNIPYVATMNPLIIEMAQSLFPDVAAQVRAGELPASALIKHPDLIPVWWSLALGACLGGNGTYIGASANVIVVGLAERARHKITFVEFFKYGFPIM